ncbi:MAG: PIN domain-containing protein [Promethearchaeota archaeon]
MNEIEDSIAIDTSVLIEFFEETELGKLFQKKVIEDEKIKKFFISPIVHTEILYIFCRKLGFEKAKEIINDFLQPFDVYKESLLREGAANFKCQYAISIADCYSLSLAITLRIPLYMKREAEIDEAMKKYDIPVEIKFIDDFQ